MAKLDSDATDSLTPSEWRRKMLKRLPRVLLGVFCVLLGILNFTNRDLFSEFLLYISVYVLGVFFFLVGALLIGCGLWLAITAGYGKRLHRRLPWLDLSMTVLLLFAIGVLLSAGLDGAAGVRAGDVSSFYGNQMALLAPETSAGNTFQIQLFGRLSAAGGGYFAILAVGLGNSIGITIIGTRIVFGLLLIGAAVVLLRHPVLAIARAAIRLKAERLSAKVSAPIPDPSAVSPLRKSAEAESAAADTDTRTASLNTDTIFVTETGGRLKTPPQAEPGKATVPEDEPAAGAQTPPDTAASAADPHSGDAGLEPFGLRKAIPTPAADVATPPAPNLFQEPVETPEHKAARERFQRALETAQAQRSREALSYELEPPEEAATPPVGSLNVTTVGPDNAAVARPVPEGGSYAPAAAERYVLPGVDLLQDYDNTARKEQIRDAANAAGLSIRSFFRDYQINASVDGYTVGASITRFKIRLEPGVKMSAIDNVLPNLRVALHGNTSVRFVPVIEGADYSGIEIGNPVAMTVPFKDSYLQLMADDPQGRNPTLIPLGQDVDGRTVTITLADMPHLLVAGSTGSGKSVFIHSLIMSLIMRTHPRDLKFLLIDPKKVEFSKYAGMPHLYCPIVTDAELAVEALHKMVDEMERRYTLLQTAGAANLSEYRHWARGRSNAENLPLIVVIIDEFADLMMAARESEDYVARLAAKARACGIHLVVATQRPSTQVITGDIKNNIPARIALMVSTQTDSRVILDDGGAENLLGRGDLLAKIPGRKSCVRAQSPYVSDAEITAVVGYLKSRAKPVFNPDFLHFEAASPRDELADLDSRQKTIDTVKADPLYPAVKEEVLASGRASSSFVSRRFGIPFNKAASFLDAMEDEGLVKSQSGGKRIVLGAGDEDDSDGN